jgi:hypothetical protein
MTIIPAFLSSCISGNRSRQDIVGKKLVCDSLLLFKDRDYTLVNDSIFKDVSVMLWIDSTKCSQCELERLINYDLFSSQCEKILGKEGRIKVVISLSESYGLDYLIDDVKYLNHSFDVLIDYKNRITSMLGCNERLLFVLKDGIFIKYYHIENAEVDAYKMKDCLDYLENIYEEQHDYHDKKRKLPQ